MCRFVAYKGNDILMADLLLNSKHSLVKQSYHSKERDEPLNGDGFGVGWYVEPHDPVPCFFTSVTPAWSNNNLHRLSEKIRSHCFFAHVRAATSGLPVNEVNCHPFQYGRLLWMHNGMLSNFRKIKRKLRRSLSDERYDMVQGTTDSEHAFALFLDFLGKNIDKPDIDVMKEAMVKTVVFIRDLASSEGCTEGTFLNFAVTDGENVIATRYVSGEGKEPLSLYFSCGSSFELHKGDFRMKRDARGPSTIIISSEPLTKSREDWMAVPVNHMVTISGTAKVELVPIG